uniref:[histone H3]-trimethyl-L-lysine(4) demethylase n=1 Tax=Syphacia muris TaxID=451379 RepID=A0A0N5AKZ0_9BILA
MDTKYLKFYKNFKPPPFAPTYRPTEAEFADPVKFIEKIKPEAEKYGIVKIKPPKGFQPPFAIKSGNFTFTPRIQKLNKIDGLLHLRLLFEVELSTFWKLQGHILSSLSIDGKTIDLYKLSRLVAEKGGNKNLAKKWKQIGKHFNLTGQYALQLESLYWKWVLPFEQCLEEIEQEEKLEKKLSQEHFNSGVQCSNYSNSCRSVTSETGKGEKSDPVDDVICERCKKGDDEEKLLLCEDCNGALHIYCCDPPLTHVPETDWRCYKCVKSYIKSIGDSFGFNQSHQECNLVAFAEYANTWKRDYFGKNIFDISPDEVESEFWKKVADVNCEVSVKYGTDLSASKVGSGFPVLSKDLKRFNVSDNLLRYAEHPWNLNNMAVLKGSLLTYIDSRISGMLVPWIYIGMCFATFCWHTEDHWLYSINYLHWGERKIWYGVSGLEGNKFDEVVNSLVPDLFRRDPNLLHHLTTIINPMILEEHGINVYTIHQEPGEFVITFPHAYHSGFNEGLNCSETVNFAPYDWLPLGGLCVNEYARVRRRCVFSHDQLIINMVKNIGDLDLPMKVALYDELEKLIFKEKKWRSFFPESNHRYERTNFKIVYNDQPECVFCRSTLFLSALSCKHAKLACLMHADKLCKECEVKDYYVKYCYTLEELLAMKDEVAFTIGNYIKWKEKAIKLFRTSEKSSLEDFRKVLKLASMQRIPPCELLREIGNVIKDFESTCAAVKSVLFPNLSGESVKRDYDSIMKLNSQVEALACKLPENLLSFHLFTNRLNDWKKRVDHILEVSVDKLEDYDKIIEEAKGLVAESNNCDVQLPQLGKLKKLLKLVEWINLAKGLMNWCNNCSINEVKLDFDSLGTLKVKSERRWTMKAVEKLINDGVLLMDNNSQVQAMVDEVHSCMKLGLNREFAKVLMDAENQGSGIERANELWSKFKICDWLSTEKLDDLRSEIAKAKNVYNLYTESKGKDKCDLTCDNLQMYDKLCKQSLFMNESSFHKEILQCRIALKSFMGRIKMLFTVSTHPSAMYNILCNNFNVTESTQPTSCDHNMDSDGWSGIEAFGSSLELVKHLESSYDEFQSSLIELRKKNEEQAFCAICSCRELKYDKEFLKCCLCFRKTHVSCAKWDDFLYYLPSGYYLCTYCHRSRRPGFDEVKCYCKCAPPSLAKVSVEFVLQHCVKAHEEAAEVFSLMEGEENISTSLLLRFEKLMLRVLSSAVVDPEIFKKIASKLPIFQKRTESQLLALKKLRCNNKFQKDLLYDFSASGFIRKRSHSVELESNCKQRKKTKESKISLLYKIFSLLAL